MLLIKLNMVVKIVSCTASRALSTYMMISLMLPGNVQHINPISGHLSGHDAFATVYSSALSLWVLASLWPVMYMKSYGSTSSLFLGTVSLLHFGHSDIRKMVSPCDLHLYFPRALGCPLFWALLFVARESQMLMSHPSPLLNRGVGWEGRQACRLRGGRFRLLGCEDEDEPPLAPSKSPRVAVRCWDCLGVGGDGSLAKWEGVLHESSLPRDAWNPSVLGKVVWSGWV